MGSDLKKKKQSIQIGKTDNNGKPTGSKLLQVGS